MPSSFPKEGMKRMTVDMPDDLFFALKKESLEREMKGQKVSVSQLIREAIGDKFKAKKKKQANA